MLVSFNDWRHEEIDHFEAYDTLNICVDFHGICIKLMGTKAWCNKPFKLMTSVFPVRLIGLIAISYQVNPDVI